MRRIRIIVVLFCFILPLRLCAQVDTEFWFAIPYLVNAHDNSQLDGMGQLCITAFSDTAHVTITQPALTDSSHPRYLAPLRLTVNPATSVDIPVAQGWLNRVSQSGLCDYGLHIESDVPVTAYYAQVNANSEIYTLKGRNALGTSFVVPMQRQHSNAHSASSSIEIIATQPNTQVTITTPVLTATQPSTTTFTVVLNEGQAYTIYAASSSVTSHLGGTVIVSDKPIAVNSTDDSVASTGQDLIGEQLVPQDLAGSEYIAIKGTSTDERLYFYTFPGQLITYSVNGGTPVSVAASSVAMLTLTESVNYISASAPFVCFQLTGDGGELGGTVLPRLDCTGSQEVSVRRRFPTQRVALLVKTAHTSSFFVNGQPLLASFTPVPNAMEWSYCLLDGTSLFDAMDIAHISNSEAIFHCSILDYGGGTCSYGYFSGYNHVDMVPVSDKEIYCVGDTIHLSLQDAILFDQVQWTCPDGTMQSGSSLSIPVTSFSQGGYYTVTGTSVEGCLLSESSYSVLLHVAQPIRMDTTVCISSDYPSSTVLLRDSLHMGQNILRDTLSISSSVSSVTTEVYRERIHLRAGTTYQLDVLYSASSTSRVTIRAYISGDEVVSELNQRVTSSPRRLSATYVPAYSGPAVLRVEISSTTTPSPVVSLASRSLRPMLLLQDSLYVTAIDCSLPPQPHPCPATQYDTTRIHQYCDTLLPYSWRALSLFEPGTYRDTLPTQGHYDEVCDSIIYVLLFDTIHCEREHPAQPCPATQYDTTWVLQLCDTLLPYQWRNMILNIPGNYDDTISTVGSYDTYCDSIIYTLVLDTIHCPMDFPPVQVCYDWLEQRWDDVLFVRNVMYNGGYTFVSYRWFCNGLPTGDTGSYIYSYTPFNSSDVYEVEVVTVDGQTLRSCPFIPQTYETSYPERVMQKKIENQQLIIMREGQRYTIYGLPL